MSEYNVCHFLTMQCKPDKKSEEKKEIIEKKKKKNGNGKKWNNENSHKMT